MNRLPGTTTKMQRLLSMLMFLGTLILIFDYENIPSNDPESKEGRMLSYSGKLFSSGWPMGIMKEIWFPDFDYVGEYTRKTPPDEASPNDILLFGMHGPSALDMDYLEENFPGKVVFYNGEPHGNILHNQRDVLNFFQIGGPVVNTNRTIPLYHGIKTLIQYQDKEVWPKILDPNSRSQGNADNKRQRIAYVASNCLEHRQNAANDLSKVVPVDSYGMCVAGDGATRLDSHQQFTGVPPNVRSNHKENWKLYGHYKYCLVMENSQVGGYISEKLLWAFLGGCLPIYWGTEQVFDVFNKDAFLFYDFNGTTASIIEYLEGNATAYEEYMAAPILANGEETLREYFSVIDEVGGGLLKRRIRSMVGLPNPPLGED